MPSAAPAEQKVPAADKQRAELEAMKKQINKSLVDAKVDPKVIAAMDKTNDPKVMFGIFQNAAQEKTRELEAMAAAMKAGG